MEILVVNSNLFKDPSLKELMMEDLSQVNKVICVYGTEEVFNEIACVNEGGVQLHLGFSPLSLNAVFGFLSFYAFHKNLDSFINISHYDNEGSDRVELTLFKALVALKNKNENYSSYLQGLDDVEAFIDDVNIPTYKSSLDLIKYDIELDKLLVKIFNYQYLYCEYKNIRGGLSNSINNETLLNKLYGLANKSFYKGARWIKLKDCLDLYVSYKNNNNERALILYVSLFLSMANFYKKMLFSAHAYLYLLRTVEIIACFYLIKNNYISEQNGKMNDSYGVKIVGAGPFLNLLKDYGKIDNQSVLFDLLEIRNNSFQGHGLFSPTLDKYNSIYTGVRALISEVLNVDEMEYYGECNTVFQLQSKPQLEEHLCSMFN